MLFQKTRNTSLPNKETDKNMKNNKIIKNLYSVCSVPSSGFPELGPPDCPYGAALFGP
jgi:hypothetical protein